MRRTSRTASTGDLPGARLPSRRDRQPETIPLSGPAAEFVPGFNLNGIEATLDGRTLIVVNSAKGLLYTVDARTGASAEIDLGDDTVQTGDGILLVGPLLFVLQNGAATATTRSRWCC